MTVSTVMRRNLTGRRIRWTERIRRVLVLALWVELETLMVLCWGIGSCPTVAWVVLGATGAAYVALDVPWWVRDLNATWTAHGGGW